MMFAFACWKMPVDFFGASHSCRIPSDIDEMHDDIAIIGDSWLVHGWFYPHVLLVLWSFAAVHWNITMFNNGIDPTQWAAP